MTVNFFIGVFNLIPAFPMDGGRILRALLAIRMSRTAATRIASSIGQAIALGFVFLRFFYNLFLSLIGVFIFFGARSEWFMEQSKFMLGNYKVSDIVMHQYHHLTVGQTLQEATDVMLDSSAKNFLIIDHEKVVGTLSRIRLLNALSEMDNTTPVGQVMDRNFRVLTPEMPLTDNYNLQKGPIYAETIMPVIKDDRLVGALDMENISEFIEVQQATFKRNNREVSLSS